MADLLAAWVAAMRAERFDQAWAVSEQVLRMRDPGTRDDPSMPYHLRWVWDGRSFDARHVLVRCYHGLGDTIQFARYLPALAAQAASVTIEAQPCLLPLLAELPGVGRVVAFDPAHPLPPAECDVEIMELAFALRGSPAHFPPPYLSARSEETNDFVGICHLAGAWDSQRSIPAELLESLCREYRCVSLVPGPCGMPVVNPEGCSIDIGATASLVASAALIITVDTMVAHLAGALGRPTWLLLKAEADWRWSLGRTSCWYPSMRLYRQPRPGDWASVIAEVKSELAVLAPPGRRSYAVA
jgi:hypothetical protein